MSPSTLCVQPAERPSCWIKTAGRWKKDAQEVPASFLSLGLTWTPRLALSWKASQTPKAGFCGGRGCGSSWAVHLSPHSEDVLHKELPICETTACYNSCAFLVVGRDPGVERIPDALVFLLFLERVGWGTVESVKRDWQLSEWEENGQNLLWLEGEGLVSLFNVHWTPSPPGVEEWGALPLSLLSLIETLFFGFSNPLINFSQHSDVKKWTPRYKSGQEGVHESSDLVLFPCDPPRLTRGNDIQQLRSLIVIKRSETQDKWNAPYLYSELSSLEDQGRFHFWLTRLAVSPVDGFWPSGDRAEAEGVQRSRRSGCRVCTVWLELMRRSEQNGKIGTICL